MPYDEELLNRRRRGVGTGPPPGAGDDYIGDVTDPVVTQPDPVHDTAPPPGGGEEGPPPGTETHPVPDDPPPDDIPDTGPGVPDFVPEDFSDRADDIRGFDDSDMDYTIPEAGDVDVPMSSGTADPTPTDWEITPEQTVQGQLLELYDRDSPFFELARQRAIRQHLSSGGQNSAMAGGFGEMAAMDAAFQVAQQDAALYARSAEFNATMQNQFSLAEQAFIHNAMLSDQSYQQARELQTQRLSAQMEAIILDYKGRSALMDKELDQWFLTAAQSHEYNLDLLWEQASVTEGQAGRDFARTMTLNGMLQMTNFYTMAFQSVLQYANNPNFTPEQQAAAMREGMMWASQQFDFIQSFWGQWGAGGPPGSSSGLGFSSSDALASWWDFNTTPQWWQQAGGQTTPQGAGFMGGTVTV